MFRRDAPVELRLPLGDGASRDDRRLATQLRTRTVLWGCQIAANSDNTATAVIGKYSANNTRPREANAIEVGIAVAPPKDWEPPYVSILLTLPRDTSVSEQYVTNLGNTSTQHIVEMRPRGRWIQGHDFKVTAKRFGHVKDAYMVDISDHQGALVLGYPWLFRSLGGFASNSIYIYILF